MPNRQLKIGNREFSSGFPILPALPYLRIMSTKEILDQIQDLPASDKIWLVEETLKSLNQTEHEGLAIAAHSMMDEDRWNKELTAFTEAAFSC